MCFNWALDLQNIINDTKIRVLSQVLAELWTAYILMVAILFIFSSVAKKPFQMILNA